MAKQIGDIIIAGTIDDITFYVMEGKGYARSKSSLTGKRVKKDPRFRRTMESARRLGRGSQLASKVYRSLPREEQVYALFKELKRIAILAMKEGKGETDVQGLLQQRVEMTKEVTRTGAVRVQPDVRCKTGQIKKAPRLFRVQGGRLKEVYRPRAKGRRLVRSAGHPRTSKRKHQQRE
jgi:hypothetical protein